MRIYDLENVLLMLAFNAASALAVVPGVLNVRSLFDITAVCAIFAQDLFTGGAPIPMMSLIVLYFPLNVSAAAVIAMAVIIPVKCRSRTIQAAQAAIAQAAKGSSYHTCIMDMGCAAGTFALVVGPIVGFNTIFVNCTADVFHPVVLIVELLRHPIDIVVVLIRRHGQKTFTNVACAIARITVGMVTQHIEVAGVAIRIAVPARLTIKATGGMSVVCTALTASTGVVRPVMIALVAAHGANAVFVTIVVSANNIAQGAVTVFPIVGAFIVAVGEGAHAVLPGVVSLHLLHATNMLDPVLLFIVLPLGPLAHMHQAFLADVAVAVFAEVAFQVIEIEVIAIGLEAASGALGVIAAGVHMLIAAHGALAFVVVPVVASLLKTLFNPLNSGITLSSVDRLFGFFAGGRFNALYSITPDSSGGFTTRT